MAFASFEGSENFPDTFSNSSRRHFATPAIPANRLEARFGTVDSLGKTPALELELTISGIMKMLQKEIMPFE